MTKRKHSRGRARHRDAEVVQVTGRRIRLATAPQWLYGVHTALAALANPDRRLRRYVLTEPTRERLGARLEHAIAGGGRGRLSAEVVERHDLDRLLPPGSTHQGIALLADPVPARSLAEVVADAPATGRSALVVLDQATDPQNVGAVLRSAAAFGAGAVVVPSRHTPEVTGALAKAASGALERLPLVAVPNIARALVLIKDAGFWCVGLDAAARSPIGGAAFPDRVALVLGAEGTGLRRLTRGTCDELVRIPMAAEAGSLNLAAAAAIALYELKRTV